MTIRNTTINPELDESAPESSITEVQIHGCSNNSTMNDQDAAIEAYLQVLADLHSRWEFHLPLVEAQFQYRERYYGLASAQLLEDLYLDALTVFVQQHRPKHEVLRPPRGIKEYDYEFDGQKISHKVSKSGAIDIAVLWDATKKIERWSSTKPIALECAFYPTKSISVASSKIDEKLKILTVDHRETFRFNDQIALVKWSGNSMTIRSTWEVQRNGRLQDNLDFMEVWQELAALDHRRHPINEHELVVFRPTKKTRLEAGDDLFLHEAVLRPGTYLFPTSMFKNVSLKSNNRAQLIPKELVRDRMKESQKQGLFVPSTTWYSCYSASEPPNLFLTQKQELDARFKAIKLGLSSR